MAWIESHQTLGSHPKTLKACKLLDIQKPHFVGHLHYLWWWCVDYAPTGDITKYSNSQLADAAMWLGDPNDFVNALTTSGFLDRSENQIKIHDWLDFCGALMERRLKRMVDKRLPLVAERPPTNRTNPTVPNQPNQTAKRKRVQTVFSKPTAEEVYQYAKAMGFKMDCQRFYDHYEANGWRVGKNPMKDWKATVRNWNRSEYNTEVKNASDGSESLSNQLARRRAETEAQRLRGETPARPILPRLRDLSDV